MRRLTGSTAVLLLALAGCSTEDTPGPGPGEATPYAPSAGSLAISDPALAVDGYTIWLPEQKQNDPRAGEPSYVYLAIVEEGVALPGPTIEAPGSDEQALFKLEDPSMSWEVIGQSHQGLTVVVNARLSYRFEIQDFEEELSVARVDLALEGGQLESRFILIADGCNGVAHQATVTALVDGAPVGAATGPWTIETRSPPVQDGVADGPNGPGCSW